MKPLIKEEDKGTIRLGSKEVVNVESKVIPAEEADSKKPIVCKDNRNIDLQHDLEKTTDRDGATANVGANKLHQHVPKQPLQPGSEKPGSAGRFPFFKSHSPLSSLSLSGFAPKGFLIQCCFFTYVVQYKRALFLCPCLYLAGQVGCLLWGTVAIICCV